MKILICAVVSMALTVLATTSCKLDKGQEEGAKGSSPFGAESKLASVVLNVLKARLQAQAGLTDAQSEVVVRGAKKKMGKAQTALRLAGSEKDYENDFVAFADDLTVGAIESFANPNLGVKKRSEVNNVLKQVIANTFHAMRGKFPNVEDPKLFTFLVKLTDDAISALDEAGYPPQDIDEAVTTVMDTAISNLKNSGILTDKNAASVIGSIVQGAVHALKNVGIDKKADVKTQLALQGDDYGGDYGDDYGSVEFVDDGASDFTYEDYYIDENNIDDFNPHSSLGDFDPEKLEVDSAGADPRVVYAVTLYKMMKATVPALKNVDFTKEQITGVLKHVMYAFVASLDEAGFDMFMILTVIDEGVFGALDALDELGLDENEIIKGFGKLAEGAMGAVNELANIKQDKRHLIVETITFILADRLSEGKTLSGKGLERALEGLVADGTQGLKKAKLSDDDYAAYVLGLLTNTLHGADSQIGVKENFATDKGSLAKELTGVALGTGKAANKTFEAKFKQFLQNNDEFSEYMGDGYDFDDFYADADEFADSYDYVYEEDDWGDSSLADADSDIEGDWGTDDGSTDSADSGGTDTDDDPLGDEYQ